MQETTEPTAPHEAPPIDNSSAADLAKGPPPEGEARQWGHDLSALIDLLEAERDEWKKRCLYATAETENLRRRHRLDLEESRRSATAGYMSDLLPVLDNFSRALDAAVQSETLEGLKSGLELISRQLEDALTRQGLQRIDALGQTFDPNIHEAIMQSPPEDGQKPNTVIQEFRTGWRLQGRVLRPSLVKVTSA